jgi:hypothetical protein
LETGAPSRYTRPLPLSALVAPFGFAQLAQLGSKEPADLGEFGIGPPRHDRWNITPATR